MLSAWFEKIRTEFVARAFGEVNEFESAREIDYVNERLQNDFLISSNSNSLPLVLTDHDPLQVRSQGVARGSCGAH